MLLDMNRFVDPDGEIHLAWARARETLCGVSKIHWPYPNYGQSPTCKVCRAFYMIEGLDELQSDLGFPEIDQLEATA